MTATANPSPGQGVGMPAGSVVSNSKGNISFTQLGEWLLTEGFSIIPLHKCDERDKCKKPLVKWEEYQKRPPSPEEVREWAGKYGSKLGGWAVLGGPASGNLVVLGFEHEDAYKWFRDNAPDTVKALLDRAMKVLTGVRSDGKRGVHVYIRLPPNYKLDNTDIVLPVQINATDPVKKEPLNKLEIRGEGRYVVGPGYTHYSGVKYCVEAGPIDTPPEVRCDVFTSIVDDFHANDEEARQLIEYINKLAHGSGNQQALQVQQPQPQQGQQGQQQQPQQQAQPQPQQRQVSFNRRLSDDVIRSVVDLLREYNAYQEGFRDKIQFYLQGMLLKAGFNPDDVKKLASAVAEAFNDEEKEDRVELVDYQVSWLTGGSKALSRREAEELKVRLGGEVDVMCGARCLIEVFKELFKAQGKKDDEALGLAKTLVRRIAATVGIKYRILIKCKDYRVKKGRLVCVKKLYAVRRNNEYLLYIKYRNRITPIGVAPYVERIYDKMQHNWYFMYKDENDPVPLVASDLNAFVSELRNKYLVGIPPSFNNDVVDIVKKLAAYREGYITSGFTPDGFVDVTGLIDTRDYGIEGLVEAWRWVRKYYGRNASYALANIALLLGKLVAPATKLCMSTFMDYIVYNESQGGQGKTTLVNNVLIPLLGINPITNRKLAVVEAGAYQSQTATRNILSMNTLPLILDEQDSEKLEKNATFILSITVGANMIGAHARIRGQGIDEPFMALRGVIINTNVPHEKFIRKAAEIASERAIGRRLLPIKWFDEEFDRRAFDDLPMVKPIIGAVDRVFRKYREELLGLNGHRPPRDVVELARLVLEKLRSEYAVTKEEVDAINDYLTALEAVVKEAEGERARAYRTDDEVLREAVYDWVRKALGVQVRSIRDLIDTVIENAGAAGIDFEKVLDLEVDREVWANLFRLFMGHEPGSDEELDKFVTEVASSVLPERLMTLLHKDYKIVRVYTNAFGGRVPNTSRGFMGSPRHHDSKNNRYYYNVRIDRFIAALMGKDVNEGVVRTYTPNVIIACLDKCSGRDDVKNCVLDCLGIHIKESEARIGEAGSTETGAREAIATEQKTEFSASVPNSEVSNQQVSTGDMPHDPQTTQSQQPPSGGESKTTEPQQTIQANPPSGGGSINDSGTEPKSQPRRRISDEERERIEELSAQCRRKYLIERHDFNAYKECMHSINLSAGPVPEPPSELLNASGELGREVTDFVRDFLWFKYVVEEEVRNIEEYGGAQGTLGRREYRQVQDVVSKLLAQARSREGVELVCKAACWVTESHYHYDSCVGRCSQCTPGDVWDVEWTECRKRDEKPKWFKTNN